MSLVLFAPDLVTADSAGARAWVLGMCRALRADGHQVLLHPRERDLGSLAGALLAEDVEVLPYDALEADHEDAHGHLPRFRARRVVIMARHRAVDVVVAQGGELCLTLTGGRALGDRLWTVPVDVPFRAGQVSALVGRRLDTLLLGSRRVLVASEDQRAWLEAEFPASSSRLGVLPTPADLGTAEPAPAGAPDAAPDLEVCLDFFAEDMLPDLAPYAAELRGRRDVPRLRRVGASGAPAAQDEAWREVPGLIVEEHPGSAAPAPFAVVPTPFDGVGHAMAVAHHLSRGTRPVVIADVHPEGTDPRVLVLPSAAALAAPAAELEALAPPPSEAADESAGASRPDGLLALVDSTVDARHADGRPLRVVLAGSDFKFAGDLILDLAQRPDVDFRVDLFADHAKPQPEVSRAYLEWADVVITEFARHNSLWYAENIRPHQRLIVHLHGYELLSDWIDELRVERCDAIVVASEAYRRKALEMKGWPDELVRVIPNSVDEADLARPKFDDARFHLGMAGYVPILKRPDRALDLLRLLREQDDRYVLHLRGHSPWDYQWEWKKSAHQDAYRAFFRRIGQDPLLRDGIVFEGFGPDMGGWLRHIGWILSPSHRETFHLAGVEGAASGAVPLVWRRDGSTEIFGDRWNFGSTQEIADFVLAANRDEESYRDEAGRARASVARYGARTVTDAWAGLMKELADRPDGAETGPLVLSGTPATQGELLDAVVTTLRSGSYEQAFEMLNAGISLTAQSTGALKDAELWVRGVAAVDARRLSLYLPRTVEEFAVARPALTVRRAGDVVSGSPADAPDRHTFDIAPFPFADPREDPVPATGADLSAADLGPRTDHGVTSRVAGPVRADRWLEAHAAAISAHLRRTGLDQVVARGPWWVALAVALAADRLGIPATWVVTDPLDVERADRALATPYAADFIDYVALRTFEGMSRVVDRTGALEESLVAARVPLAARPLTDLPGTLGRGRLPSSPNYEGIPAALERDVADLRLLVAGDDDVVASWQTTGADVARILPDDLPEAVAAGTDLIVVDAGLVADPIWAPLLTADKATAATPVARLFDVGRAAGARSLLLGHGLPEWPAALTATLRKADLVTAGALAQAEPVLRLNPLSVERVLPVAEARPWEDAPSAFLRSLGLPVRPQPRPAPQGEGISLILATHQGAGRIRTMLDSIAAQTIPAHLVEVVVVENGGEASCEGLVREFAEETGLDVRYVFRPEPGVGGARNRGLQEATRTHVAFVDDDDVLERNHLLAAWLSTAPGTVALSPLHDLAPDGTRRESTALAASVAALQGRPRPLASRPDALGQNACKVIPADVARDCVYAEHLHSGEDVAFMAQLLGRGLRFAPAADMAETAYLRVMRENSVSRRALTFDFAVRERLEVIRELAEVRRGLADPLDLEAVDVLITGQSGFVSRYRDAHPEESAEIDRLIDVLDVRGSVRL